MRRGLIDQDQALGEEGLKHFHDTGEVAGSEPTEPNQLQFLARTNEGHTGFRDGGTVREVEIGECFKPLEVLQRVRRDPRTSEIHVDHGPRSDGQGDQLVEFMVIRDWRI